MARRTRNFYINLGLLSVTVLSNGFILLGFSAPALQPTVTRWLNPVELATDSDAQNSPNTLIIPKIQVRANINTGDTPAALKNGLWLRPKSVLPGQGGNTILSGHRFSYREKSILYNLDQLAVGDEIQMIWDHKRFNYVVREVKEVGPNTTEIEEQTGSEKLTLYTCTPLWSAYNRLVVIATRQ